MAIAVLAEAGKQYRSRLAFAIAKTNQLLSETRDELNMGIGSGACLGIAVLSYPMMVAGNYVCSFRDLVAREKDGYVER